MHLLRCSFLLWPAATLAQYVYNYEFYGPTKIAYYSCSYYLPNIGTFCDELESATCICLNENAIMTMLGCLAHEGKNDTDGYNFYAESCLDDYGVPVNASDLPELYQKYLTEAKNSSEIPGFNLTEPVDYPLIVVDEAALDTLVRAYAEFLNNYDHSLYYGAGTIAYWLLMMVIAMVCNWGVILFPKTRDVFNGTFSKMVRKYITLPALARRKKNTHQGVWYIFDCLVPSRMETIVIVGFFWFLFIVSAVEIYYVPGDTLFLSKQEALTRYVSDRTGVLSTILVPLVLLYGGRNNFLQWVTRWKFSTMITFHRWMARMVVALAFVHSVGYTWMYIEEGYYAEEMAEEWLIWGVVATACGGLICFQGLLFLRRKAYEVFLILHILLAGFFLIGLWFHVCIMGYSQFVYPCFAIWGFDRFVRVVRILWFGFPTAVVSLLPDNTVKVEVPKPKSWPTISGGHAWIYFGLPLTFWQNHPFTFVDSVEKENTIVFFCKSKKGITATLRKKLQNYPGKTTTLRVGVDGPYGGPSPVSNHSTALYVAGGSGLPGIYSEATAMAKKSKGSERKIKLVWVVREVATVAGFLKELQALKDLELLTVVYLTLPVPEGAMDELFSKTDLSSVEKDKEDPKLLSCLEEEFPHIEFRSGRPDLKQLLSEEIAEAKLSLAVVTCGHPLLVDDLRYNVVQQIDQTSKRLDFYEQLQVWA